MDKEILELRKKVKKELIETVKKYLAVLEKFEEPFFNLQKSPRIKKAVRDEYHKLYEELKKHLHNLKVFDEELAKKEITTVEEDVVFTEIALYFVKISDYIINLPKIIAEND